MFPSLATADDAIDDVSAILDLIAEDMPKPAPLFPAVSPEHFVAKAARESRDAAARQRAWRERQKETADVNGAIADALVTADWRKRDEAKRAGQTQHVQPINLGDVTRLAYQSLRKQGYSPERANALLVPRLSPERAPLA